MFEYLKDYCNQKIDKLNNEYLKEQEKLTEIENNKKVIKALAYRKDVHRTNKFGFGYCASFLIAFALLTIFKFNPLALILSIGFYLGTIHEMKDLKISKEELDDVYQKTMEICRDTLSEYNEVEYLKKLDKIKNYKKLDRNILEKVNNLLNKKNKTIEDNIEEIVEKADEVDRYFDGLVSYEVISNSPIKFYAGATTEKEFDEATKIIINNNKPIEEFLLEQPRYQSIQTYNELGNKIKYKDKPKQFVKKI